ncbi:hypothetical protein L6164_018385 [Bauhinia variegata]|uniref:Uncharacterized protein n=1 Tax=Bauhinia variegata TaxID=167791 RepID=A0ACB9NEI0_BAUVA|nr:hypothetical protein L6164_018385 [Bauhinia variegata]
MAEEDKTQKCDHSSSGCSIGSFGKSFKKPKQKKVPQRGLGVAQLEKIRIEELQKKDAAPANFPFPSSVSSSKSSYLPLPIPNFHHSNKSSTSSIPFPSGSPPDFRSPLSFQNFDVKVPNTLPLANNGSFEANWPAFPVPGQGNVPKLWNSYEFDFERESSGVDPGLAFRSSFSLPCESNLPNWVQRTQQYQQPCSSMVNVSSVTSSTPILHYSIEPPSNQNYSGSCAPMQQEEKMIGLKRSYPFSLDVPPASSFNLKLHTFAAPMKANETTSCGNGNGNGSGFIFDAGNSTFREVPSSSTSNFEPNSKKINKESENLNRDFLSLAPPLPTTSCPPSNIKPPSTLLAFDKQEYPDFESSSCQGNMVEQVQVPPQEPFYSFFPQAAKTEIGQTRARMENCNVEAGGENVDLNLKL